MECVKINISASNNSGTNSSSSCGRNISVSSNSSIWNSTKIYISNNSNKFSVRVVSNSKIFKKFLKKIANDALF